MLAILGSARMSGLLNIEATSDKKKYVRVVNVLDYAKKRIENDQNL
jgi:hypothetical protein